QGALPGRVELLALAADEGAGDRRSARLCAPRRAPGLLLAGRPRLRVGTDAPRARPGRGRGGVEPARLGPPDRTDRPRSVAAAGQPPARHRRVRTTGR